MCIMSRLLGKPLVFLYLIPFLTWFNYCNYVRVMWSLALDLSPSFYSPPHIGADSQMLSHLWLRLPDGYKCLFNTVLWYLFLGSSCPTQTLTSPRHPHEFSNNCVSADRKRLSRHQRQYPTHPSSHPCLFLISSPEQYLRPR